MIWIKDEQQIPDDDHHYNVDKSEPNKFKLHIIQVNRTDKGYYQCKITTNGQPPELSEKALLTVNEITGEPYPICETSMSIYDECDMVRMTCTTENKSPLDKLEFSETLERNTTCQCINGTHQWATIEFLADDDEIDNRQIACIMSNNFSKSRHCSKTLHTMTKSTPIPTTKSLYSSPSTIANSECSKCECPNTYFITTLFCILLIIILVTYILVNYHYNKNILTDYSKLNVKGRNHPIQEQHQLGPTDLAEVATPFPLST
ncbi:uncharacterized protein LOC117101951 isoform X2 [Anneissia japonica]|nr:uncharacterized protein LOC117101951 isoform X2 [Anneissia japonica]